MASRNTHGRLQLATPLLSAIVLGDRCDGLQSAGTVRGLGVWSAKVRTMTSHKPLFNAGASCYDSFATGWDSQQIRQGLSSAGSMPALSIREERLAIGS